MAKAAPSEQAAAADTPAPSAPEPTSGSQILKDAKDALRQSVLESSPAEQAAPDSAAAPTDESAQAPQQEEKPAEKEGSRREQGQKLREQIRRELEAEYAAKQKAEEQRRQNEEQQKEFEALLAKADAGDWEAKDRVLNILKSNSATSAAIGQGRTAVLEELGRDITAAVYGLDGLDEDGQQALLKAASVADFGKIAFDYGKRLERAVHEDTIATLRAENESLKGRLAGNSPSPTATNGTSVSRGPQTRFASMRDAFAASAAELGYRNNPG